MVHRKSEYKLQYHVLPNDLRKQIWQENLRFRLKNGLPAAAYHAKNTQDIPVPKQNKEKSVNASNECKFKDTGVQTNELQDIVLFGKDSEDKSYSSGHTAASDTKEIVSKSKTTQKKSNSSVLSREFNKTTKAIKRSDFCNIKRDVPKNARHLRPRSAASRRSCDKIESTSPGRRSRSPSPRFSVLSRTSRRSFLEQKQPAFTDYGWNDTNRNVGDKKTYNTLAPKREIHPLALQALRTRRAEIEECLAQERQMLNAARSQMNLINHDSIWMTEYKDKYCSQTKLQKQTRRPVSSPAQRSITWTAR